MELVLCYLFELSLSRLCDPLQVVTMVAGQVMLLAVALLVSGAMGFSPRLAPLRCRTLMAAQSNHRESSLVSERAESAPRMEAGCVGAFTPLES